MTRTKEQLRKAVFGKLQVLRRKLHALGVPCDYARSVLSHQNGDTGFTITYRLADDQTTLLPQISTRSPEGTENLDHLPLDQGLARIKELHSTQHGGSGNGQAGSSAPQGTTDDQDRDSNGDPQSGNSYVVVPDNQTLSKHEGDAK